MSRKCKKSQEQELIHMWIVLLDTFEFDGLKKTET